MRVVVYRKRVAHRTPKNFQLDLFDPDDGYYEYSAVVTNKPVTGRTLWFFMCGRGTHEKVYGELKSGFAFDCVPTERYQANSAWQVLSIMAFNVIRGFQARTTAEGRRTNRKRRTLRRFEQIHTLRYRFLNRAGLLVQVLSIIFRFFCWRWLRLLVMQPSKQRLYPSLQAISYSCTCGCPTW